LVDQIHKRGSKITKVQLA